MSEIAFVVEHAGCASCAERISGALATVGRVQSVEIDEADDSAAVRLAVDADVALGDVDSVLADASEGSGHEYRVKSGSWVASA